MEIGEIMTVCNYQTFIDAYNKIPKIPDSENPQSIRCSSSTLEHLKIKYDVTEQHGDLYFSGVPLIIAEYITRDKFMVIMKDDSLKFFDL
jgi:hypothetical protein